MEERVMVVVAGGSSTRFEDEKLLSAISGKPLIVHTIDAVSPVVDRCILVARADQIPILEDLNLPVEIVQGGQTRTASEAAGLFRVRNSRLVGIHDGARPLITPALVARLFKAAENSGGAVPVLEPSAPIIDRDDLSPIRGVHTVQTPQVFWGPELTAAYAAAEKTGFTGHDTADIVLNFTSLEIAAVPGDPDNIKVTYPEDLERVRALIGSS